MAGRGLHRGGAPAAVGLAAPRHRRAARPGGRPRWPEELARAFSTRHEQISAELERLEREEGKPRTAKLIQEVDPFNTACQQLRDHAGHLGPDRLQVGDRSFAVGDLVVCGKNALRSLGVANGSRGQILALDAEECSLTQRLDVLSAAAGSAKPADQPPRQAHERDHGQQQ